LEVPRAAGAAKEDAHFPDDTASCAVILYDRAMMRPTTLLAQLTAKPHDKPCDARWDEMVGDDRVRHCGSCARDVYDVSAMCEREAEFRLLN
jgi:hypothetical protein